MSIAKYALLAWYAVNALTVIATIGKPKKVTTPGAAAVAVVILAGLCWLVVLA